MLRDLASEVKCLRGISPPAAAPTGNTAIVSEIVDTANFGSCTFVVLLGSIADADATFTVLVEDGDNASLTDNAAVADAFLVGAEATPWLFSDDNKVWKIGYIGPKRYVRVTITPAGNSGDFAHAGVWILGHPRVGPQSTQLV